MMTEQIKKALFESKRFGKLTTRKQLKAALDRVCSFIVVGRDEMQCVTCGADSDLTASHLFKRGHENTRWDLENIFAQCSRCNGQHNRHPGPLTGVYLNQHAVGDYTILVERHKGRSHFKAHDLVDLLEERLQNLQFILDQKGLTLKQIDAVRLKFRKD